MFRFIGVLFGAILIAGLAVIVFAQPILEVFAGRQLAKAGFSDIKIDITELTPQSLTISSISGSHQESRQTLAISNIDVDFNWRELLEDRRVRSVSIGPGRVVGSISETGDVQIAGIEFGRGGGSPSGLPFSSLAVDRLSFAMATPGGVIDGQVDGQLDADGGGTIDFSSKATTAGASGFSVRGFASIGAASFSSDGNFTISLAGTGSFETMNAEARAIDATFSAQGGSWRTFFDEPGAALIASAVLDLKNAELEAVSVSDVASNEATPVQTTEALINELYGAINAKGSVRLLLEGDGSIVVSNDTTLELESEKGNSVSVTSLEGQPILMIAEEQMALAAKIVHRGAFEGYADVIARSEEAERWAYEVTTAFDRQLIDRTILRDASLVIKGVASSSAVSGNVDGSVTVSGASVGRFRLKNAPISTMLNFDADLEDKTLVVAGDGTGCVTLAAAAMRILEQDLESEFRNAQLCADGKPLLSVDWSGAPQVIALGEVTADWASYRLGETTMIGAPPRINFAANYAPDEATTSVVGEYEGGTIKINDALIARRAKGKFSASLLGDELMGEASMSDAIITQALEPKLMAPMRVNGSGTLASNIVKFNMAVETIEGDKVAVGSGTHNVDSGLGEAEYTTVDLEFLLDGLKPHDIVAPMRGTIENTEGFVQSDVRFSWDPENLRSSGNFSLAGLSFLGPEPVVTRTTNVSGSVELSDLLPATTKGVQEIAIGMIELGALVLENGLIEFELPGDESLNVISAHFPWFGGSIGAYDTQIRLSGSNSETVLKAEDVNLQDLLAKLDIEGLSGEGIIAGTLPISVVDGKAFVKEGVLEAVGAGIIRYQGAGTDAAAESNEQANVAFGILREMRFEKLTAKINGPLDGNLNFDILMEGTSLLPISDARVKDDVSAPVIYRVKFEDVPLLALFEQAQLSTNIQQQLDRARNEAEQ